MGHWDPNNLTCRGCSGALMEDIAEMDGAHVMWCPACGTLLTADEFNPISASDWHTTTVANRIDGSSTRWLARLPKRED